MLIVAIGINAEDTEQRTYGERANVVVTASHPSRRSISTVRFQPGTCAYAEIESLLMMRPPRGVCAFMTRIACCVHRKHSGQVDIDHALEIGQSQMLKWHPRRTNAGIVEEQVEVPKPGLRPSSPSSTGRAGRCRRGGCRI